MILGDELWGNCEEIVRIGSVKRGVNGKGRICE